MSTSHYFFLIYTCFRLFVPGRAVSTSDLRGLVLTSSLLASLELFEVPAANGHVALVLVHAVGETLDVRGAWTGGFSGRALGVQGVVHGVTGACIGVGGLLLLFNGSGRGAATEKATDGMAEGGADSDATTSNAVSITPLPFAHFVCGSAENLRCRASHLTEQTRTLRCLSRGVSLLSVRWRCRSSRHRPLLLMWRYRPRRWSRRCRSRRSGSGGSGTTTRTRHFEVGVFCVEGV